MCSGFYGTPLSPRLWIVRYGGRCLLGVLDGRRSERSGFSIRIGFRVDCEWFDRLRHEHRVTVQATVKGIDSAEELPKSLEAV